MIICKEPNCGDIVHARSYCNTHYRRVLKYGVPEPVLQHVPRGLPRRWIKSQVEAADRSNCWTDRPWKSQNKAGYPTATGDDGKQVIASHLVLKYDGRPRPTPEALALHSCDNPQCLNPDHLRWGDFKDNYLDMLSRDRQKYKPRKGEKNHNSKLTWEKARYIREQFAEGVYQKDLATELGVSRSVISEIVRGIAWVE